MGGQRRPDGKVPDRYGAEIENLPSHNTDLHGTHRRLLKNAAFAHFESRPSTTATSCVRREGGAPPRGGVADCTGQSAKTDAVIPLRRRRFRAVSVST